LLQPRPKTSSEAKPSWCSSAPLPAGGFEYLQPHDGAPHRKHLPGNPSIVVQNMPGAGQLIAANHLYNRASRDGLTIGHFSGSVIFRDVMGDKSVMFDGKKFGWLGTPAPERHTGVITEKPA